MQEDQTSWEQHSLQNHFLISMPGLIGSEFENSITYICNHGPDGAMGIVITQALDLSMGDVFKQMNLNTLGSHSAKQVLSGGPVSKQRGFVLHEPGTQWQSTVAVAQDIALTASKDIIVALANDKGPKQALFALGYAGWGAGQLESEISENSWLTTPADTHTLFNTDASQRWRQASHLLGFDPNLIPTSPGHA